MKRFLYLLILGFFLQACDNTLDVIEDRKDIPVVYGFLSMTDTAQYIRVEKAFVDENISALELAQDPDSLYYANPTVELVRKSNGQRYQLQRVDGNLEGYVKDDGAFAQSPNYLYKIKSENIQLVAEEEYILSIKRSETTPEIESETVLLGPTEIKSPSSLNAVILDFNYVDFNLFIWQASESASIHDLYFKFNYRERSPETNGQYVAKSAIWNAVSNIDEEDERVDYELPGINFYSFVSGAIDVNESAERRFENMEMIVVSGGEEIKDFVNVSSANLGITSTQDVPTYSNIEGGRGIFSSTYTTRLTEIGLSNRTIDSLVNGQLTQHLNFIN